MYTLYIYIYIYMYLYIYIYGPESFEDRDHRGLGLRFPGAPLWSGWGGQVPNLGKNVYFLECW